MHEGHRKRMIERLAAGEGKMQDHELIEILLYNVVPRRNTNETAHRLLQRFGTLYEVFHADMAELEKTEGVGPAVSSYLRVVGLLYERIGLLAPTVPMAYTPKNFSDWLLERYEGCEAEVFEVFCFNDLNRLFDSRRFTSGFSDRVLLDAATIIGYISEKRPAKLIIAHTHPDGDATPSAADDKLTNDLCLICSLQRIEFNDHLIIARNHYYSYFQSGRLGGYKKSEETL